MTDPAAPLTNSFWRHRNGILYQVIAVANTEGDDPGKQDKYPPTVVYRSVTSGKIWARRLDDWYRSMTVEAVS